MKRKGYAAILAALMLAAAGCNSGTSSGSTASQGGSTPQNSTGGGTSSTSTSSSAPADDSPFNEPGTLPIVKDGTITLSIFCPGNGEYSWADNDQTPLVEQMTGIKLDWNIAASSDNVRDKISTMFASGDMTDIILTGVGNANRYDKASEAMFGAQGLILPLEQYLDTVSVGYKAAFEKMDGMREYITTPDGHIYSLPNVDGSLHVQYNMKLWLNNQWLENLNLQVPTTTQEFYEVMKAFKEQDANGNGDPNDEVPLGITSITDMFSWLYSKYDLMNRGTSMAGSYIDADPADPSGNTIRAFITADEMKDVLKDAKHFWDEKLLPSTLFDADYYNAIWSTNISQNWAGFHTAWATATGNYVDDYIALPNAPTEKWNNVLGYLSGFGSGVITKECEIPEAMVSWFNYLYTIDGAYEFFLGIEGESYIIDDQGHVQLTEKITNHPELEQEQAHLRYSFYSGGGNPALATDETFKGGETYITSLNGCDNFRPATEGLTIWEAFPLNSDQTERINNVKGDISAVYKEYTAAFVTGTKDIDADWQEFLDKLNAAGLEEYLAAYQEAYDVISG